MMIVAIIASNCSLLRAEGILPVMNFLRSDYNFGTQNWDMTQDQLGKIYIANYNGMMVYDGLRWKHYYLPNYTSVRSVLYDNETNCVFAGGTEEFGFFSPDNVNGELKYQSLSASLPAAVKFSEVWDIIKMPEIILFRCDNCLFGYKDGILQRLNIPGRISYTKQIGRKVLIGMEDGKILSLKDGNLGSLKEEGCVDGKKIVAILPFDDNYLLVCTPVSGLFLMKEGEVESFSPFFSDFLKSNQLFCANCRNGIYTFGTVTGGALVWDTNTSAIHVINKETGMKNNTVLNTRFDREGNLWLCLDNGLTYASLDSPCRKLIGESQFIGAGYASARVGDKLLLGTNQGLYIYQSPVNRVMELSSPQPLLQGQVWSITETDEDFFISTDRGLYLYKDNKIKKIEGVSGTYQTLLLHGDSERAISSTYDSFYLLKKINNNWEVSKKISGGENLTGYFHIDEDNRVWLSHWQKGIYILAYNPNSESFTSCSLFNKERGLPENDSNSLSFFEGAPISSTYAGFFNLNPEKMQAFPNEELTGLLKGGRKGHLRELTDGILSLIDEEGLMIINRNPDGEFYGKEISGPGLYREIIPGFTDIHKHDQDHILVSTQSGFTLINTKKENPFPHTLRPFINNIFVNQDSLIYKSPLSPGERQPLELPYNLNTLRFEYAYPECNFGEKVVFSSFLENYDKSWSPFSPDSFKEYTRLPHGNYVLHLRVKDNYSGEVLESSFGFIVNPPWFRSVWAKGFYTVLSFLILLLLFASVRKKLTKIKLGIEKRKERELEDLRKESERETMMKDMEIAGLKTEQLEQEIRYKSDELSATTMSLINKNEILREIGDQVSKIKKMAADGSITAIQKNLSKLQASIEENITKDADWNTFNKNFDIVYGDYVKRLLKLHPSLSQSEKRLCCYIRMGLSSKEIAPLVNISFRSVEMARYRLRKKINLAAEASLSDYLNQI